MRTPARLSSCASEGKVSALWLKPHLKVASLTGLTSVMEIQNTVTFAVLNVSKDCSPSSSGALQPPRNAVLAFFSLLLVHV